MVMIIFLPPIFNENHEEISIIPSITLDSKTYTPNIIINRVYKSQFLIIYEIEQVNVHYTSTSTRTRTPSSITIVSSQKNSLDIKSLYKELRYELILDLLNYSFQLHPPSNFINVFCVVLGMNFKEEDPKCTTLQLFDFDIKSPVTVKLWRGLATWITSLSIGARIQIRNLHLKDSTLHSCSTTEIYLLAHGNSSMFNYKSAKVNLSARSNNLNEKEREILLFLSHQSLLIPSKQSNNSTSTSNNNNDNSNSNSNSNSSSSNSNSSISTLKVTCPLYLEYKNNRWTIQGTSTDQNSLITVKVTFYYFDAKIWQILNEIFMEMDNLKKFDLLFHKLKFKSRHNYEFLSDSSLSFKISTDHSLLSNNYKKLDWNDLISSKVILFGVFELEAILDDAQLSTSEESIGNLSIDLPNERSIEFSSPHPRLVLRNPKDHNQFIYTENAIDFTIVNKNFMVQIKTILNDGNFNEIIRKMVFIL